MGDFSCQSNHQSICLLLSCLLRISRTFWVIIIKLPSNNPLDKLVSVLPLIQLPRLKVTVLGHRIYPWILCLLHTSWTFRIILIRLHSNIPLIKMVRRTHDLADRLKVKVILQGLGIYPSICVGSLYPLWMIFIKLHSNVLLIAWISYPYWRSHFKVKRFCWRSFSYLPDCCLDN